MYQSAPPPLNGAGTVSAIKVKEGDSVAAGDTLIELKVLLLRQGPSNG